MSNRQQSSISRRHLLALGARGAALLAGAGGASGLSVLHAAPRGLIPPPAQGEDYRALVCVFLYGGADLVNLLVPRSAAHYSVYAESRQGLAEPLSGLLPIHPATADGAKYGLHPRAPELAQRFEAGDLAFVANVGPLVAPTSKAEYEAGSVPVPRHLFSHNDQQVQWQIAHADGSPKHGWCGRVADRIAHLNGSVPLSTNISFDGPVPMLTGSTVAPYGMAPSGTESLELFDPAFAARHATYEKLLDSGQHVLERGYARIQREAVEIDALISTALPKAPSFEGLFPAESFLASQLRATAKLIAVRGELGMRRQVFFVSLGGFDTHDQQVGLLPGLFGELSAALGAFQSALEEIGAAQLVTTFTSSDFGRTLSSNGKGSDHGWGGHAFVLGGAVRGGDIYGAMPDLALGGPDDIGEGRLLPSTSVDQYAATLSRWFGLDAADRAAVFPNLAKFEQQDLGFV